MVSISKCPRCEQFVSLPDGVDLDAMVRCPLCGAEYALRESLPPALVPIGGLPSPIAPAPAIEGEPGETAGAAASTAASEGQELGLPEVTETGAETAVAAEGDASLGTSPVPGEVQPDGFAAPLREAPETGELDSTPAETTETPDQQESAATAEGEQPAPGASGGGMFDFLNSGGDTAVEVGTPASGESESADGPTFPMFGSADAPAAAANGARPSSIAARPRRRKEKNVVKEMIGAIIGGFVGLSIGYYGLNYLGGERFDFLNIWLPGVSHTQKHWTGTKGGDEAGSDASAGQAAAPDVYPADPKPEGAILRGISRYIDINFQYLVMEGKIRPDSNQPPVVVTINGEEFMTAPEGEIIETIDNVQIGGAKLKKGYRLKKEQQWWVELGEAKTETDPADVAMGDPKIELEPVAQPEPGPKPKKKPLPAGYIGPKNRGSYSLAQLGEALKGAHTEFKALKPTDDLSDSLYQSLCVLAERLTFIDVKPDAAGLFDRQLAIETMLESLGLRAGRIQDIGIRAAARLDDLDTADGGIVLAGTSGREVVRDGLHGTMLALPGGDSAYNVLSDKPLGVEEGDTVLIAGVAVTDPSENLIGYPGNKPVVIWAALAVKLPKPLDAPADPPMEPLAEDKPAEEAPPTKVPAEEAPTEDKPADTAPAEEEPAEEKPAEMAPAEEKPVDEPPAEAAPAEEAPADPMPADPAPAEEEPVDEPPAEATPAEEAPADPMPADPAPAEDKPADEPPAEATPAEEAPADPMSADPAPAEDKPADEPPAEAAPAEEAPADPMPADPATADDKPDDPAPSETEAKEEAPSP
ncbi:MAG: hypothetical protein RBS80_01360 [Thermoguttaceae bacterium]|jgi:hypothetical protein|nr:hypothetical protein [Thermoguttaceae bacterium]